MLYLTGISGKPPHREIRKVALGAEEIVAWRHHENPVECARKLKQSGVKLVALEITEDSVPYNECAYAFPMCLIVGNEYHGITPELLAEADLTVHIPMRGGKISLNVAVAYGVAIYEITRQAQSLK